MATKNVLADVLVRVDFPLDSKYYDFDKANRALARSEFHKYLFLAATGVFKDGMPPTPPYAATKPIEIHKWENDPLEIVVDDPTGHLSELGVRNVLMALINERYAGQAAVLTTPTQQVEYVIVDGHLKCIHTEPMLVRNVNGGLSVDLTLSVAGQRVRGNPLISLGWAP